MEFVVKQGLANVRPSKTSAPEVSTTPTAGNFKINAPGALAIGVKAKDYLNVVIGDAGRGDELFIAKGVAPVKDEAGKIISTATGAKLASPNDKMSGTLQASSANIFTALEGSSEGNVVYAIDVENPEVLGDTTYYRLTKVRTEPKQVKGTKVEA